MYEQLNLSLRSNFLFRSIYYLFHDLSTFKDNASIIKNKILCKNSDTTTKIILLSIPVVLKF